jgi:hypothetical protein
MSIRTVRLDNETEKVLDEIVKVTRLSKSDALKKGLFALRDDLSRKVHQVPYDIYKELELGPGGYAVGPSTDTRRGVQKAIRKKLGR